MRRLAPLAVLLGFALVAAFWIAPSASSSPGWGVGDDDTVTMTADGADPGTGRTADSGELSAAQLRLLLASIPFGSLSALQHEIVSGELVDTVSQGRFIVARYDDNERVSYRVALMKRHPPALPQVIVIGGSAVRECTTSDPALRSAVAGRFDHPVGACTLASSMQRYASSLAIIDNLPADCGGVVVIGVHHLSFAGTAAEAKAQLTGVPLKMTSGALHDLIRSRFSYDPPNHLRTGLRRLLAWYLDHRGRPAFTGGDVAYLQHRYHSALSTAGKLALTQQFKVNLGAPGGPFFDYFALNRALLRRCVTRAREKGYQIVLMEDPQDTAVVGSAYNVYKQKYQPASRRIARECGAHYVNLNTTAGLVNGDFFDISHLLSSGRRKWTPKLAAAVAQVLRDHRLTSVTATASDPAPLPDTAVTVTCVAGDRSGHRLRGANVTFTWRFESGDKMKVVRTGARGIARSTLDIAAATPGYEVMVDVAVRYAGKTMTSSVSFTPAIAPRPSPTP